MNNAEVEARRAEVEAKAVGPMSSSLLITPDRPAPVEVFFGVRYNDALERLHAKAEAAGEDGLVSVTQWGLYAQDEISASLEIEWPEIETTIWLFFEVSKWRTELGLIRDGAALCIVRDGLKGTDKLRRAIAVEAESDLLTTILSLPHSTK